ncbi:MAG: pimeloyl-ACP methyl ester carboxylesterase [Polaribacter sp.]|jgi:pimeloyl-ACP methyl ester carboxylesterase
MLTGEEWKSYGQYVKIQNQNVFVLDTEDETSTKETIVIITGYPSNGYDYHQTLPILAEYYRVIIHDHLGFGLSKAPIPYCLSLIDQANVCLELWAKLKLKHFIIIADGFGAKVAEEILYRKNANLIVFNIKKLIISNSTSNQFYADLKTIAAFINNKESVKYKEVLLEYKNEILLKNIEGENLAIHNKKSKNNILKLAELENQKEVLVLSSYNDEDYLYWHRWMNAIEETTIPIIIFWRKDDIANIKDTLLHIASNRYDNIKVIENTKCFVLDKEPISWALMVLKEIDKSIYDLLKIKFNTTV